MNIFRLIVLGTLIAPLFFLSIPAQAQTTIRVDDTCSLVDAIIAANTDTATGGCSAGNGADIIELTADVVLTESAFDDDDWGPTGLPMITSPITIQGNGFAITRVEDAPGFRIMWVGQDGDLTLEAVTVSGGQAVQGNPEERIKGGGILSEGTLTVNESTISDNTAGTKDTNNGDGGGIWHTNGTLMIINSSFSGNQASLIGGAVHSRSTNTTILGSEFSSNKAVNNDQLAQHSWGGALALDSKAIATITNTKFENNFAGYGGGAIVSNATMIIRDSRFITNRAGAGGGAIDQEGQATIINSEFDSNRLVVFNNEEGIEIALGAAIRATDRSSTDIVYSSFQNNSAYYGGAIDNWGTMTIRSSAFFSNITRWGGGAIHNAGELTLRIESSTFSENTGIDGGAILISDSSRVEIVNNTIRDNTGAGIQTEDNPTVDIVNTLITGGLDNGCVNGGGQVTGHHNLGSETSCPGTEILRGVASDAEGNGGPTVTYALPSNSNAIDAGDPALCPETDQRGATRVGVCDIGAFEYDGNLDGDGDGVDTVLDNCPAQANPNQENADGDGLGDVCDACPNAAGFKDGCPDADGDGIQDAEDECPNEWGIPASNGCLVTGVVQGNVNLRGGPGTNFDVMGAVTPADEFALTGRNAAGDWLRVRTLPGDDQEAVEAWIFADLVTTDVVIDDLPVVE